MTKTYQYVVRRSGFYDYKRGGFLTRFRAHKAMIRYIVEHPTGNLGKRAIGFTEVEPEKIGITNLKFEKKDFVKACPFCGMHAAELCNTHTASYWVECQSCGAQVSGKAYGTNRASEYISRRQHTMAKKSALAAWNRRNLG